jgi:Fe-S cluster biosynthesis and repair protein YggX
MAIQICAVRLYGRFLQHVHDLPPSLTVEVPEREATNLEHRQNVLKHLGRQQFDQIAQEQFTTWIERQAQLGVLPEALFQQAEHHLLDKRILLPGPSVLERLIIHVCADVHAQLFATIFQRLSPALLQAIDRLLTVPGGEQRSTFAHLKEYPPAPSISSIQSYLQRYQTVAAMGIDDGEIQGNPRVSRLSFQTD